MRGLMQIPRWLLFRQLFQDSLSASVEVAELLNTALDVRDLLGLSPLVLLAHFAFSFPATLSRPAWKHRRYIRVR